MMRYSIAVMLLFVAIPAFAQTKKPPTEDDFYRMIPFPLPPNAVLEVGGLDWYDADKTRLLVCTRRGELWVLDNVYADPPAIEGGKIKVLQEGKTVEIDAEQKNVVQFKRMLFGLHEPLGMVVRKDGIIMAQRTELTRVRDTDGDDKIDIVEALNNQWEVSGNYHEYAFGPKLDQEGNLWVTLNRPFGGGQENQAYWRGWAIKIDKANKMHPVCPGLRSPCGLGMNPAGDMFYTDNQGDWTAVCKLSHLKPGLFQGEAVGLDSTDHPLSNMKHPGKNLPKSGLPWAEAAKEMPWLVPPAVWFPYPEMGRSHSDVQADLTGGKFGPFAGQLFVGDQGNAIITRVFLEKVGGEYQGACFPFRKSFGSGVLRMCWGKDGSMFVGGTNRGWGGGSKPYSLDRLVWTGKTPFEVLEMKARPNGFELKFTMPVDPATAGDVASYKMKSWTYNYHRDYGDKQRDEQPLTIAKATVSSDNKSVILDIDSLKPFYVHELRLPGVKNAEGDKLLHDVGYYTLQKIPTP
jgi:hypothetical protein